MIFNSLRTRILAVILSGAILVALDSSTISPVLYSIQSSFAVSEREIVWVFNIEILFLMLMTPVSAKLSDIFGRKRVYLLSVCSFIIGTLIVTLTDSFTIFLLGRAFQGVGAVISVLAIIIIGDHFTENRGTILGIFGVVIGVVYAMGPVLSGFLVNYDWHYIFACNLPVSVIVLLLSFYLLPWDKKSDKSTGFDWKGMLFLGLAITSFALFINEYGNSQVSSYIWILIILCAAFLALFLYFERSSREQILPMEILRQRNALITCVITLVGYIAGAGTYFLSSFAILAFGLDYSQGAYILVPFTVSSLLATMVVGKLLDIVGPRPIMVAGGLCSAAGMLALSISGSLIMFCISIVLIGVGVASIAGNALYYLMLSETGSNNRASGQGMLGLLLNAGSLIGGALLGAALDTGDGGVAGFRTVYICLAVVYLGMTFLVLNLKDKKKSDKQESPMEYSDI